MDESNMKELEVMAELLSNINCNVGQLVQNQSDTADVASMRKELEAYRSDTYFKLMRNYGVDALIKTYTEICTRIFNIENNEEEDNPKLDVKTLRWTLSRLDKKFKPLGIRLYSSNEGDKFEGSKMEIFGGNEYDSERVMPVATNSDLKEHVKQSVVPAFIWNIPSLNGDPERVWYIEREKVTMYK